ncbi:VOC family protein [Streptomyces sp. B3I8]|uniref:VOC family protein n=1 Tax=Streptomyces sp. B3I8 TaxID=3042303 RepID=UPI0027869FB5|nr:VOC family protein [Streptomyces sp. B3I8]MDQ0787613.1 putative enzyme related to lactoylglutathione lyase [Streptomyces sp. B3I8]
MAENPPPARDDDTDADAPGTGRPGGEQPGRGRPGKGPHGPHAPETGVRTPDAPGAGEPGADTPDADADADAGTSARTRTGTRTDAPAFAEGVPCWIEVQLSDVEAGRRFYGELFGWSFEPAHDAVLWARRDGASVAALVPKGDGRMPTVWTVYFAAPDLAALTGRIRGAGGQVITGPSPVGPGPGTGRPLGVMALAADPEGAVFGLWQAGAHAGFARRHEPGTFTWAELYTRDTRAANDFYADLFHDALFGPGAAPDFGRAAVADVFPPEMPPHFLVHFAVGDVTKALATVQRLGGRTQVSPFSTSYGTVAVVTDNQGASFALLER